MSFTWFKIRSRQDRRDRLRKIFDEQVLEFTEDNMATHVQTFMEDMLAALPESSREFDVEELFVAAAKHWRG